MSKIIHSILQRLQSLKSNRSSLDSKFQEISDFCLLHTERFNGHGGKHSESAESSRRVRIYDETAANSVMTLASEIVSNLTSAYFPWFQLKLRDHNLETKEVSEFFEKARDVMLDMFNSPSTMFHNQFHEFMVQAIAYGTAVMYIDDAIDKGVKFSTISLAEVYLASDAYDSNVDTVFRCFKMSARQIVARWADSAHPEVQKMAVEKPDSEIEVLHAVFPKTDEFQTKNKGHNFVSYYIDIKHNSILSTGGYYESPYIVARFSKVCSKVYGRSPTWVAMPTIKVLNKVAESLLIATQHASRPMVLTTDDGVFNRIKGVPGEIVIGGLTPEGNPAARPFNQGVNPQVNDIGVQRLQKQIRDVYHIDEMIFKDSQYLTATEVIKRQEQALKRLAPYATRLHSEGLVPMVNKVFNILVRAGKFKQIPQVILDNEYEIDNTGTISVLQKNSEVQKISQLLSIIPAFAQLKPEVLDYFNFDLASLKTAESIGVWRDIVKDDKEVAELRKAREQQQNAQAALNASQQVSEIAGNLAPLQLGTNAIGGGIK